MTEPFIGEIQLFGFPFAPLGWAFCNGPTLAIQQNTALFSLLGTNYGGNGMTTFQLPNFTGRTANNQGAGPGLTPRTAGETYGQSSLTLSLLEMPAHAHAFGIYNQGDVAKKTGTPAVGNSLTPPSQSTPLSSDGQPDATFAPNMLGPAGNGEPHENRQPYLAVNYCIALQGVFPPFS